MNLNATLLQVLEIVYLLTVIGVIIVVISENRNPIKTVAWIMAVIFLPVVGLIWYAIFGQDITKKRSISKRTYVQLKRVPLRQAMVKDAEDIPQYSSLINLLRNIDDSLLFPGNSVKMFTGGEEKFDSLIKDLKNAKHHIHLEYYVFMNDELGERIQKILIEKAERGVQVRIIYDGFGSRKVKKEFFRRYEEAGVELYPFLDLKLSSLTSRFNYRTHRKIVVIDGQIGYVGGINVADRYINGFSWGIWRDTHARIEGPGVQGLQSVFLINWLFVSKRNLEFDIYFPEFEAPGNSFIQIVNSGPMRVPNEFALGVLQAIYSAKKTLYIQTPYFLPPEPMIDALSSASLRGVDVRLMLSERSDVALVQAASLSYLKKMLRSGVKVYFYQKGFLHAKMMTIDGSLTILGSGNFDFRSFEHNYEIEAFIYDSDIGEKSTAIFRNDMAESREVSLEEWIKRPLFKRFIQSLARLFAPLF